MRKVLLVLTTVLVLTLATFFYLRRTTALVCPDCNVILISIDTLRADRLGCMGNERALTPNIDAFAAQASVFETAISHAPSTTPAHASIFTSLIASSHGASASRKRAISTKVPVMAELLQSQGYATASFNGGAQMDARFGFRRGFDIYESAVSESGDNDDFKSQIEKGIAWIEKRRDQKFFLFLHTYDVHHPYLPSLPDLRELNPEYSGPLTLPITATFLEKVNNRKVQISDVDRRFIEDAYDAEVMGMDTDFGVFWQYMQSSKLLENTIVIFTSDHGEEFGERRRIGWHSHTLFDELLHVPLIMSFPQKITKGIRITDQVRGVDILPTVLQAIGHERLPHFQGESVLGLIDGREESLKRDAYSQIDSRKVPPPTSLRTPQWKFYKKKLFNLIDDPEEKVNHAAEFPELYDEMRIKVEHAQNQTGTVESAPAHLDPEAIERLESLGYAG